MTDVRTQYAVFEAKKDCACCGAVFCKTTHDSVAHWRKRKFCSKTCANRITAKARHQPLTERYWAKVVRKTDGCWDWLGCKDKLGYGRIGHGTREHGTISAHRASWIVHFGTIPEGLHVLHECDNPTCTRPDHLFLGTHADNMADMARKGRAWRSAERYTGTKNPNNKLRPDDIPDIYRRIRAGERMTRIANDYGVTPPSIHDIKFGRTWRYITGAPKHD